MKMNVGIADRAIRIVLGIAIAVAGYYYQSWWGLVAIVPLLTGLVGTCPLYTLLGINSCSTSVNRQVR